MQVDSMHLVLRPRAIWEGCDIGVRLLQSWLRPVYFCHLAVAVPLFVLFIASFNIASWLPCALMWVSKPWLDRTILFALSRGLFGQSTTPADVWAAQRPVWWRQFAQTLTLRRLSASRSFTQPLLQLEGLTGRERRSRMRYFSARQRGVARIMTQAFAVAEIALASSILSLPSWFGGPRVSMQWVDPISGQPLFITVAYAAAVLFVEPFYVAAGFGMYLNRRVELEAWDIEQEFRRVFAS